MELVIKLRENGPVTTVILSDKILVGDGDLRLREALTGLLDRGRNHILLVLTDVSYVDSAGLGELFASYSRAVEQGGALRLVVPAGKVRDLLRITRLDTVIETYSDEQDALLAFLGAPARPGRDTPLFDPAWGMVASPS